ncbi:hypothetical protein ACEQPO_28445 [Bacillus sp. SL00103]
MLLIGVAILSIILALFAQSLNVAFLVSILPSQWQRSANLPLIIFTVFWKRFNSTGAIAGSLVGLLSALIIVSTGPSVWDSIGSDHLYRRSAHPAVKPWHYLDPARIPCRLLRYDFSSEKADEDTFYGKFK